MEPHEVFLLNVFLATNAEGRLRQATLNRWRSPQLELPTTKPVLVVKNDDAGNIIGASGCFVTESGIDCSFTVVKPDLRQQGIGKDLLTQKVAKVVALFTLMSTPARVFETIVPEDKEHVVKLVKSAGLVEKDRTTLTRGDGNYTAIRFVNAIDGEARTIEAVAQVHAAPATPEPDRSIDEDYDDDDARELVGPDGDDLDY